MSVLTDIMRERAACEVRHRSLTAHRHHFKVAVESALVFALVVFLILYRELVLVFVKSFAGQ